MAFDPLEIVPIADLGSHVGRVATVRGFLYNKRGSKKLHFLEIRDGTGTVQSVVFAGDVSAETFETAGRLTQESSLVVVGEVRSHPKRAGEYEIGVKELSVLALAEPYPISPKEHGVDFLMDHRHL
jgi:asparaginyl-tRNA synthetase